MDVFGADHLLVSFLPTGVIFLTFINEFFSDLKETIFVPMGLVFILGWITIDISPIFLLLLSLTDNAHQPFGLLHVFFDLIKITLKLIDPSLKYWLCFLARSFNKIVVSKCDQKLIRVFDFATWKVCDL